MQNLALQKQHDYVYFLIPLLVPVGMRDRVERWSVHGDVMGAQLRRLVLQSVSKDTNHCHM
jgi:hypothetical protein